MNKQKVKQIVKVAKTVVKAKLHISVIQTEYNWQVKYSLSGFRIKKKKYTFTQPKCKLATLSILAFEIITIDLFGGARHLNCAMVLFGIGRLETYNAFVVISY